MSQRVGMVVTRREFLRTGCATVGTGMIGWLPATSAVPGGERKARACIQLLLVGGPSQLETWDPKPDAPAEVRGPFRPIRTKVPGVLFSEHFPRLARMVDRCAILRGIHHADAPIHETGLQLLQTGRLSAGGIDWPHCGAVLSRLRPAHDGLPSWVVLPGPIGDTGVASSHGQTAGWLGEAHGPCFVAEKTVELELAAESERVRERYGRHRFGRSCLLARRLVEQGVRFVTVNMFDSVFRTVTWDCHANGDLPATLDDYQTTLCPMLDQALAALLDELAERGLLDATLVTCFGEMGRAPWINSRSGRDHWTRVWNGLLAGGGVRGGQVIGSSDALGAEPRDHPIPAASLTATVYHALGIDPTTPLAGLDSKMVPLVEEGVVHGLFGAS